MLTLFRGGPTVWISDRDAEKMGVKDNDWVEAFNRNGVVSARAVVSHRFSHALKSGSSIPRFGTRLTRAWPEKCSRARWRLSWRS
jgi:anaerobic selenocysteine-containing dehydrogenase